MTFELAGRLLGIFLFIPSDTQQHQLEQLSQANKLNHGKPIGEQIQAKLKRGEDYPSELEYLTPRELDKLARQGGKLAQNAKKLLILGKEGKRLDEKQSGKLR